MRRLLPAASLLLTFLTSTPGTALAQEATPDAKLQARLDLADRFNRAPELIRGSLVSPRWLREGDRLVFWSEEGKDGGTWGLLHARTGVMKPLLSGAELRAQLSKLTGGPVTSLRFFDVAIAPDQRGIVFGFQGKAFALGLEDGRVTALAPDDRAALLLSRSHFLAPQGGAVAQQRDGGFVVRAADGSTKGMRSSCSPPRTVARPTSTSSTGPA